jgi:hypothetical protein
VSYAPSRTAHWDRSAHRARAGVLLSAAALSLAACGTGPEPAPPPVPAPAPPPASAPSAPAPATVAWTGSVCDAVAPVVTTLKTPPSVDQNAWPATRQAYLGYLDDAVGRTDDALQALVAAGPPPVENGQQLADQVRAQVEDLRVDLVEARADLAAADPNNPVALGPAVAAASNVLASFGNSAQAVGSIVTDEQLRPAFEQAPACAQLR